ncbi:uncharacterized protein TRIADDRAFT_52061 [Trichoplax adhaerens]|uniref:MAM domain-containing protein n=1 Tax=Trichoplax adhaerens TaxID=10228 RepID=B3RLN1_TRIAD|nr:predicted protein [Trichoplax adhaerens]EDV28812.1 predicted protein [Trichoplax adhaerens]|eukprot:XP_002108014.1 predicted protein [Trichoplax adhaerens]
MSKREKYLLLILIIYISNIVRIHSFLTLNALNGSDHECIDRCTCNFNNNQMKCKLEDLPTTDIPSGITQIIITDGHLRCDCSIAHIIRWAQENKVGLEGKCNSPTRYKDKNLSDINLSVLVASCNKGSDFELEVNQIAWRLDGNCTGLESRLSDCNIQIDDVADDCPIATVKCLEDEGGDPTNCNFQKGFCGWSKINSDYLSWIWLNNNHNHEGYQVLVSLTNHTKSQSAVSLQSPVLKPLKNKVQVYVEYYFSGIIDAQLLLQIQLEYDDEYTTLYSLNMEEHNWNNASVTITMNHNNFRIRFTVKNGQNSDGEIGIGQIKLTDCKLRDDEENRPNNRFVIIVVVICAITIFPPSIFIYAYVVKSRSENGPEIQINLPCSSTCKILSTVCYCCGPRSSNTFEILEETNANYEAPNYETVEPPIRSESPPIFPPDFQESLDNLHHDAPPPYYQTLTENSNMNSNNDIQLSLITLEIANSERNLLPSYDSVIASERS